MSKKLFDCSDFLHPAIEYGFENEKIYLMIEQFDGICTFYNLSDFDDTYNFATRIAILQGKEKPYNVVLVSDDEKDEIIASGWGKE